MTYQIKSLFNTRRDPHRRGHKDPRISRGRIQLGTKRVKSGQRIYVSSDFYKEHEDQILMYQDAGAIEVIYTGPPIAAKPYVPKVVELAPAPEKKEAVVATPKPVPVVKAPVLELAPEPKKAAAPKAAAPKAAAPKAAAPKAAAPKARAPAPKKAAAPKAAEPKARAPATAKKKRGRPRKTETN